MIVYFNDKPEQASPKGDVRQWFGLTFEGDLKAAIAIQVLTSTVASLHIEFFEWSHRIAREMIRDWPMIKGFVKQCLHCDQIFATYPDIHDKRWPKFIKLLGFDNIEYAAFASQEV